MPRLPITRDALGRVQPGSALAQRKSRRELHRLIDKWLGEDAEDVIAFLSGVIKGTQRIPLRAPGANEDAVSAALIPEVQPSIKERLQAAEIILAYRHGRPLPQGAEGEADVPEADSKPGETIDYSALSDAELAQLETITRKTLRERGIIEGEIVSHG